MDKNLSTTTCLNCGKTFTGDFCPGCGQKASTRRMTVSGSIRSFLSALSSLDGVFFRTMGNLLWRPGHLVRDYICGKRERYVHPVKLLSALVAIYLFVIFIFRITPGQVNIISDDIMSEHVHSDSLSMLFSALSEMLSNKVVSSLLSAFVCLLPFALMFGHKPVQRPDGTNDNLNLAEQFCALLYCACLSFSLSMVLKLAGSIGLSHNIVNKLDYLFFLLVPMLTYKQLLKVSWWTSLWRSFLAILLSFAGLAIVIILLFGLFYGIDAVS